MARRGALIVVLAVALLPFGAPRRLLGDARPAGSHAAAGFSRLCRDHGGTPAPARASGARAGFCTVRYGSRTYVMDAVTPHGFDADTARYQRRGCKEARRAERAATGHRHGQRRFTYHPATGVCEHGS